LLDLRCGFYQGASAQSIYYEPGSHIEYRMIRNTLAHIKEDFPSFRDLRDALGNLTEQLRNYQLYTENGNWYVKNITSMTFSDRIYLQKWRIYFIVRG